MLLVSAAIGGGHDAFSRPLAERLEARGAVVTIDDFYEAAIPHLSKVVSKLNRAWLLHFGRLYQWVWDHLVRRGPFAWLATTFFRLTGALVVRKLVKRHRPHVVVATYPMCVPALARLRRKGKLAAPVVSNPNDFQAHVPRPVLPRAARLAALHCSRRLNAEGGARQVPTAQFSGDAPASAMTLPSPVSLR